MDACAQLERRRAQKWGLGAAAPARSVQAASSAALVYGCNQALTRSRPHANGTEPSASTVLLVSGPSLLCRGGHQLWPQHEWGPSSCPEACGGAAQAQDKTPVTMSRHAPQALRSRHTGGLVGACLHPAAQLSRQESPCCCSPCQFMSLDAGLGWPAPVCVAPSAPGSQGRQGQSSRPGCPQAGAATHSRSDASLHPVPHAPQSCEPPLRPTSGLRCIRSWLVMGLLYPPCSVLPMQW